MNNRVQKLESNGKMPLMDGRILTIHKRYFGVTRKLLRLQTHFDNQDKESFLITHSSILMLHASFCGLLLGWTLAYLSTKKSKSITDLL
ncbi:hypothetical protein [Paucilactobacillus hokkaidonensis]|uniref:hypothetical protein n=1 Tax=Paucilactobacillus hokkaidonensis TaxID=1193095 RepID=UPI0020932251|nr:hypothetical protein [Paucilactobacillus hokkaidonensis]